ncbi:glycoside hydrolase family 5 protein [Acidobacteria bacterium AB60]|nr:glycoside hydrolase family 5 protein [Acidobacteria bacterium AB60]
MRAARLLALFLAVVSLSLPGPAQDRAAELKTAFARAQHLRHGINASEWFAQHASDYSATFTSRYTDDADIALIARLGFDSVRLSIDPAPLEREPHNNDGLNADFTARLDHAVDTMLSHQLAVQIDIHPESDYKARVRGNNADVERFTMLWRRLAAHYASRDPNLVFFEIMNEPEVSDPYRWAGIQARAAEAIRQSAPQNTLIAAGPNYSSIADLLTQNPLPDGNVIYNFHFYEPHEFTHQGAGWGQPWWIYTHNIPYPATESSMDDALKQVPDPRDRYDFQHYWLDHWDAHRIKLQMDAAADWAKSHGVPLLCNEFGAYRRVTDPASRMNWIHDVRTALEADGIGWTMWDYRGGFGVVTKQDGQPAQPDPAVVEALGLKKQ